MTEMTVGTGGRKQIEARGPSPPRRSAGPPRNGMYGNEGTRRARLAVTFARRRQVLLLLALCIWGAVWARAIQLQVVADDQLRAVALQQSDRRVTMPTRRGEILDREGRLLAINVAAHSYFAY